MIGVEDPAHCGQHHPLGRGLKSAESIISKPNDDGPCRADEGTQM